MRGMRLSALVWLAVLIAAYLCTSPVYAGEHPWDNDNGHSGSNNTGPANPGTGSSGGSFGTTATSSGDSRRGVQTTATCTVPVTWTLMYRATEWVIVNWTGVKGSVVTNGAKVATASRLVK